MWTFCNQFIALEVVYTTRRSEGKHINTIDC
jgi:hypothetical protein